SEGIGNYRSSAELAITPFHQIATELQQFEVRGTCRRDARKRKEQKRGRSQSSQSHTQPEGPPSCPHSHKRRCPEIAAAQAHLTNTRGPGNVKPNVKPLGRFKQLCPEPPH